MGEEFHSGVCSGSWWSTVRGGGGGPDSPPLSAAAAASCSAAAAGDVGSFGWAPLEAMESKARSSESAASGSAGSTLTFQGIPAGALAADSAASAGFLMEPAAAAAGSRGLASPSMNWSQALMSSRRTGEGFYDLLNNDDLASRSSSYMYQEPNLEPDQVSKDINQEYCMIQQPDLYSGGVAESSSFHGVLFPGSSALLQDLLDQDMKPHASAFGTCSTNFMSPAGFRSSSGECSTAHHQFLEIKQDQYSGDHLPFSNDSPLWNNATAGDSARTAGFCSSMSMQTQLFTQQPASFERKPSRSSVTGKKPNSDGAAVGESSPAMGKKAGEPALKKARIETPSPLPTFKVRKEKLGDRITALQQLVSPFGKTDTASVLHEAIEYIKFLQEQVGVLSTPYLKNGPPTQHLQASDKYKDGDAKKQDLRSRGLCLVPISITFPVVNEPTAADLWTPTFGGSYR